MKGAQMLSLDFRMRKEKFYPSFKTKKIGLIEKTIIHFEVIKERFYHKRPEYKDSAFSAKKQIITEY